jgi:hypothetical protein
MNRVYYLSLHRFIINKTLYHPRLLLLERLGDYIVNLSDFYSYRLIGKLTAFVHLQEFSLRKPTVVSSTSVTRFSLRRSKTGLTLSKVVSLRLTLNLDGVPITSKSHTHPSHSQTSRLLTSSLSLPSTGCSSSPSDPSHSQTSRLLTSSLSLPSTGCSSSPSDQCM